MAVGVDVRLRGAFREFAGSAGTQVEAGTVKEALAAIVERYPALRERLHDEHGRLRDHVNIYANSDDIRYLQGEGTPVRSGDVLHIIPAVSGG